MENENINRLKDKVLTLPLLSGVYLMKNNNGEIIYVGKAKKLRNRVKQYFDNSPKNIKTQIMASNVFDFDYIITDSELDAFNLENTLIKKYKPKYNILLKDDKSFPYIYINRGERFPRIQVVRRPKQTKGLFGPFVTGMSVSEIINCIKTAFKVRWCNIDFNRTKSKSRPCLHGEIGDCVAPCVGKVSEEEYNKIIDDVEDFLNGKTAKIKALLTERMKAFAQEEKFEKALEIRKQLESIDLLDNDIITELKGVSSIDIFGYSQLDELSAFNVMMIRNGKNVGQVNFPSTLYASSEADAMLSFISNYYSNQGIVPKEIVCIQLGKQEGELLKKFLDNKFDVNIKITLPERGIKVQLCKNSIKNAFEYATHSQDRIARHERLTIDAQNELAEILGTGKVYRIEGYDISNISGTNNVASMVVFENGEPAKKEYRKFKIKTVEGANDFASMAETLRRRLNRFKNGDKNFDKKPDIILIDGGLGQLHSAKEIIDELGLDIAVISLAKKDEEIYTTTSNMPLKLSRDNYALKLLQRVRDEAHRFAITYHRSLRNKDYESELTQIDGIGKKRLNAIYKYFKTVENLNNATPDDIAMVDGIGAKTALDIYNKIHKKF